MPICRCRGQAVATCDVELCTVGSTTCPHVSVAACPLPPVRLRSSTHTLSAPPHSPHTRISVFEYAHAEPHRYTFIQLTSPSASNSPRAVHALPYAPQPGEDPFAAMAAERRERVKSNKAAQVANLKQAAKLGGKGALPPSLRLAAALPDGGSGKSGKGGPKVPKRKELKEDVSGGD